MTAAARLRTLLAAPDMVVAPGVYDAITARMAEQSGFAAVYMTGGVTSLAKGYPDYGLLTLTEMVDNAALIARAVDVPVVADADTGYGNELNVTRAVREFEGRGVAAIHIEDQESPKRCGHLDGKSLIPACEFVSKIRAAAAARRDPDFVIIARTDARAVSGLDDAVARANAALAAGADMAFVEAVQTREELAAVPARVNGPCLLNVVPGGKTPALRMADAQALGYRMAIHPGVLAREIIPAIDRALRALHEDDEPGVEPPDVNVAATFRRFGAGEWDSLRRRLDAQVTAA